MVFKRGEVNPLLQWPNFCFKNGGIKRSLGPFSCVLCIEFINNNNDYQFHIYVCLFISSTEILDSFLVESCDSWAQWPQSNLEVQFELLLDRLILWWIHSLISCTLLGIASSSSTWLSKQILCRFAICSYYWMEKKL